MTVQIFSSSSKQNLLTHPNFFILITFVLSSLLSKTPSVVHALSIAPKPEALTTLINRIARGAKITSPGNPTNAEETAKVMILLPPSTQTQLSGRLSVYRGLKTLVIRKKPLYEDFLDSSQRRVLAAAVKNFGLLYIVFRKNYNKQFSMFIFTPSI